AGTRVRKGMQDLKNLAQSIRLEIQESKNKA
ncbi:MAG: histone H1, partial [Mucilaginibacter sp.]